MRSVSWVMLIVVLLAAFGTVGAAAFTYVNVRELVADSPIDINPPQFGSGSNPTAQPLFGATKTPTVPVPTIVQSAATEAANVASATSAVPSLPDPSRVTILVLGIDQRKGEKGPFRTDTILVLSLDPVRKTGAMLSIPRDIFITIPGTGKPDRINNANVIGEMVQYPNGGGPALAVKTVQSLIGVPIQRYVVINFDVFTTIIDAIGPIKVCPQSHIHDDQYPDGSYGYITVDFQPGCQELDSTKLLQYARVRHNAGDDFGRASRQQEVVKAVRDKVLSLGGVSALIGKAGPIWASIKDSIKTNLTFDEVIELAQAAQNIPKENIQSVVITDKDGYLLPQTLPSGEQVFSPIYEKIHSLVDTLFDSAPVVAASSNQQNTDVAAEAAKVLVSNGAGVDGMAKSTADKLRAKGFNITDAKNADLPGGYGKTIIRVYTNKFKTARALADALGLDGTAISSEQKGPDGVDIEVVVGKDLVPSGSN